MTANLLPGQTLSPGAELVSEDGRFRLRFESDGTLVAYAYTVGRGIVRFWRSDNGVPGASLRLENYYRWPPGMRYPAAVMRSEDGAVVWHTPGDVFYPPNTWSQHVFAMQSDGNIVNYARSTSNVLRATWSSGTYRRWERQATVQPNTPVAEVSGPGVIHIEPGRGNHAIENVGDELVGVRKGAVVYGLPPGAEMSADTPGTLQIETSIYVFDDIYAPSGTRASIRSGSDARCNCPHGNRRPTVELDGTSIRIGGFEIAGVPKELSGLALEGRPVGQEIETEEPDESRD